MFNLPLELSSVIVLNKIKNFTHFRELGLGRPEERFWVDLASSFPAPKEEMTDPGSVSGTQGQKKKQWFLSASTAASTVHYQTGHTQGNFSLTVI